MKILLTGANGYVGTGLIKYLHLKKDTIVPVGFNMDGGPEEIINLDLADSTKTNHFIEELRPGIIIHLAGNKDVLKCESDREFSRKVNYEISRNIVEQCFVRKIRLIYISTDYVFDGRSSPFHELSVPMPQTQYGKDKLAVEKLITGALSDYAIIRTAGIFGMKNDFVDTVLKQLKQKLAFQAFANLKNSPTFIRDLSLMFHIIISKRMIGTFHCAGPESLSRYDFAVKISKIFRLPGNLVVPANLDFSTDVRPQDLSMDCTWTYRKLGYRPEGIDACLRSHSNIWKDNFFKKWLLSRD